MNAEEVKVGHRQDVDNKQGEKSTGMGTTLPDYKARSNQSAAVMPLSVWSK